MSHRQDYSSITLYMRSFGTNLHRVDEKCLMLCYEDVSQGYSGGPWARARCGRRRGGRGRRWHRPGLGRVTSQPCVALAPAESRLAWAGPGRAIMPAPRARGTLHFAETPHFSKTLHLAETSHFAETSLCVETLHRAETFPPHSLLYFRATKGFHVNRGPGNDGRAGPGRTAPESLTLPWLPRHRADGRGRPRRSASATVLHRPLCPVRPVRRDRRDRRDRPRH